MTPSPREQSDGGKQMKTARIPVYLSRHTPNLPEPYGAMIRWERGDRVQNPKGVGATVHDGELKWHDECPVIDSARGLGRWGIEVLIDGETDPVCVSAARLLFR